MTPAVRHLCAVDVRSMVEWISAIPFEAWPQQTRLEDGRLRPAMVNDLWWYPSPSTGGRFKDALRESLLESYIGDALVEAGMASGDAEFSNHMLSVVMPGHSIPPHADQQSPGWLARVHVPLLTNPDAMFISDFGRDGALTGWRWHMEVGQAYLVDVTRRHEVRNDGDTPRVHFMFDVFEGG